MLARLGSSPAAAASLLRSSAPRRALSTAVTPAAYSQIEARWAKLPEAEQGAIADKLALAQKADWKTLSLEEKRAAYFIAYGPYGARNPPDPALKWSVAYWTSGFVLLAAGLWRYWESRKFHKHPACISFPNNTSSRALTTSLTFCACMPSRNHAEKPALVSQTPEWIEEQKRRQIEGLENPFKGPAAAARKA
ncbi:Cytochrome c oxidase subunit 5A [Dinochytrium kinnereticum]|nr:Cytochrome c oxidase subunit 5A [Dinochytrium kinnereticum]